MNFQKSALALIFTTAAVPAMATDINFYGKADVNIQQVEDSSGDSYTEVKSNASRLGVKGSQKIADDLSVVFKAEYQIDLDGDSGKGDSITDRNQYIGLKGNWGTALLGKNDTMLKQSQGKVDLFNDWDGDIKKLWAGENRMANTLTYISPKVSGITFGATYIASEEDGADDGISLAAIYGDKTLKKSAFYASVAFDSDVKGYDNQRATVQGKVGGFVLGAVLHHQEKLATGSELDGLLLSAKYKLSSNVTLKTQFQTAEQDGGADLNSLSVGADYALAKNTKLYTFFTSRDLDGTTDEDPSYLAAGIQYSF